MKKFFAILAVAGTLAACNNSADQAGEAKDSIDSAAKVQTNNIDSAANTAQDSVKANAEAAKDSVNAVADSTKK